MAQKIEVEWLYSPPLQELLALLNEGEGEARIAGGAVRNALLGQQVADVPTATWLWAQRSGVRRLMHRGLWWGALAILVLVGRALLSPDGDPELIEAAMLWFGAGLSMSVLVLLGAPETRMRVAAFALAGGHGSFAALAWIVISS